MNGRIVCINAGSSSLKFAVYQLAGPASAPTLCWRGSASALGGASRLQAADIGGEPLAEIIWQPKGDFAADFAAALDWLVQRLHAEGAPVLGVGHRIVHGGSQFAAPVRLDAATRQRLHALVTLAPLHQPYGLRAAEILERQLPDAMPVAVFDTAFHATQPDVATRYALPRSLSDEGVRAYGFHGLACEDLTDCLTHSNEPRGRGRLVLAHLGQGASMTAMLDRRSVACSMGFSALDGLPMGRRCGRLDPGVLLYLMRQHGLDADSLEDLLYRRSGLFGVSGVSDDMRILLASDASAAAEAVELFVYRAGRELGSLAAALGGLDALVFSGGIGENQPRIRAAICAAASWLGAHIDAEQNTAAGDPNQSGRGAADRLRWLHAADSAVAIGVMAVDEESVIAAHVGRLLQTGL